MGLIQTHVLLLNHLDTILHEHKAKFHLDRYLDFHHILYPAKYSIEILERHLHLFGDYCLPIRNKHNRQPDHDQTFLF